MHNHCSIIQHVDAELVATDAANGMENGRNLRRHCHLGNPQTLCFGARRRIAREFISGIPMFIKDKMGHPYETSTTKTTQKIPLHCSIITNSFTVGRLISSRSA